MSLKETIKLIEKQHGKGAIMQLGSRAVQDIPVISSGSLALDIALGVGGYPRGRIVEMYGPESSGKTTLALHAVAEAQMDGLNCAIIDAEHALDPKYAIRLGVDPNSIYLAQPTTGEEALDIADKLIRSQDVGLIVIDSVAALTPKAELEGSIGDAHMGLQARMMSQAMRMLTSNIMSSGTTVMFINQIRHKIGVFFGSPETTSGGNALKFFASQRLDIRKKGVVKGGSMGDTPVGTTIKVTVKKNKVAPPFAEAFFDLRFDHGIDKVGELVDLGVAYKIIDKKEKGSWLSWYDLKWQGKAKMSEWLCEDVKAAHTLRLKILEASRAN